MTGAVFGIGLVVLLLWLDFRMHRRLHDRARNYRRLGL